MKDKFTITIGIKSLEALHMFYNFRSSALSWYKDDTARIAKHQLLTNKEFEMYDKKKKGN